MVLAIDIGNTNIVIGCFDGDEILFVERVSTNLRATDLEYASIVRTAMQIHSLNSTDLDGAIISSVVPTLTATVKRAIEKYFPGDFDAARLGPYAGIAQQYLFYYERYFGGE